LSRCASRAKSEQEIKRSGASLFAVTLRFACQERNRRSRDQEHLFFAVTLRCALPGANTRAPEMVFS
jgi:hypothetical protein